MDYKVMLSRFNSKCNETKSILSKGSEIYYIPAEKRAYSPNSQKADWLRINGQLIIPVVKPVQTVPVAQPVMASMLHGDHPAPLAPKPVAIKPVITVTRYANGTTVTTTVTRS
jgi:hypothetical protein